MLSFLVVLLLLAGAFFLGQYTGRGVQDEIVPARKYLEYGIDVILLVMLGIVLFLYWPALAVVPILLGFFRKYLPMVYGVLSGATLAVSTLVPLQTTILVLALLFNFLVGATSRKVGAMWWQPVAAVVVYLGVQFL